MPRLVALSVPQPCHESWALMTPAAQGRHCAACDKVVLDFTQKTDAEILALLQRAAAPCGRFRPDQLGRPLLPPPAPAPRWRTWLAAAATVLGLREVAAEESRGQQLQTAEVFQAKDVRKVEALRRAAPKAPDTARQILRGRVTDKASGEGLPGVTVLVPGTTIGVATSADGTFDLNVSGTIATQVSYSFVGYVTQVMSLEQAATYPTVELEADTKGLVGELIIVAGGVRSSRWYTPRSLWYRISRPFRTF
ncbi:carboxypeptidase-like regulatory domain-containing protein [Hymenobacter psychrotolerans]|uniref:CarboxypepD_reg-like domain-containing protein n=1 Tax=Hymenobacter psychrotolerans DSM 18569 TaxID=1121959 RepID=A0A1M6PX74_9BACT|nr:carboxypeptidase-like regulatory domain-containing protein [Hymenobacter psychrotolerans]SHK12507.1 CarboxypepD_reg-like domain-containing protein [Hymenobacter psychrotolerans DSM 18569]